MPGKIGNNREEDKIFLACFLLESSLKRLGQGGLGTVYLAHHDRTEELVALKIMRSPNRRPSDAIRQFLLEVEKTKALQHPNIVRLREFGYDQDSFFLPWTIVIRF